MNPRDEGGAPGKAAAPTIDDARVTRRCRHARACPHHGPSCPIHDGDRYTSGLAALDRMMRARPYVEPARTTVSDPPAILRPRQAVSRAG